MAKGNGGTRSSSISSQTKSDNYILAYTAKGGPDYKFFSKYDTDENRSAFFSFLDNAPKENGSMVYRGTHLLTGDVEKIITGQYEEGISEFPLSMVSDNTAGILSFSKDSVRTLGYSGSMPKLKSGYDKFQNEPMRVRFQVETNGKNFVDISNRSHYKEEQEVVAKASAVRFTYMGAEYRNNGGFWVIKLKEK